MKKTALLILLNFIILFGNDIPSFEKDNWQIIDRGNVEFSGKKVEIKDCFITLLNKSYQNFSFEFDAKMSTKTDEVQIWSGFGFQDRDTYYSVGLRGGNHDDLYLCRYQKGGKNKMLALKPLDFEVKSNKKYHLKITQIDSSIFVFLDNEEQPRIKVLDENYLKSGSIVLGGGWLPTTFKNLSVKLLSQDDILEYQKYKEINIYAFNNDEKENQRREDRKKYKPFPIKIDGNSRNEILLSGSWLFKPNYEVENQKKLVNPEISDIDWHVMNVPNFWNPVRNWLHLQSGTKMPHPGSGVSDNYLQKEHARCSGYTFDYKETTGGWYRHWIDIPKDLKDKKVSLYFGAVSKIADVWINGHYLGNHIGMFGDFAYDIQDYLRPGKNLIVVNVNVRKFQKVSDSDEIVDRAVSVDITNDMLNSLPHGMFEGTEGGIWQDVKLIITDKCHISDVFANVDNQGGQFEIEMKNDSNVKCSNKVEVTVLEKESGQKIWSSSDAYEVEKNGTQQLIIPTGKIDPKPWSPEKPNLYIAKVQILNNNNVIDEKQITFGFRKFEKKENFAYLNDNKYWLRGANHPPSGIAPNDKELAHKFLRLMHDNNQMITRTHGAPFTETWLAAADEEGIGVSWEGTWPWLMIGDMPSDELIEIWKNEMISLVKRYRNHPSILIYTINNEMYFTMFSKGKTKEERMKKWQILSDVIKEVRKLDPRCLISCDSGYSRVKKDYEQNLKPAGIDDGDIDDRHIYPGWYNRDFYQFMFGDWAKRLYWSPGVNNDRIFFSQETSTGYPNNDSGHFCRMYLHRHYVPQAWLGNYAYENKDPKYTLVRHSYLTKMMAETVRRTSPKTGGMLLFANVCWFQDAWNSENIKPYPVVNDVKMAYEPVLISARILSRQFFSGDKYKLPVTIINNDLNSKDLSNTKLVYSIVNNDKILWEEEIRNMNVKFWDREELTAELNFPKIKDDRIDCKLQFELFWNNELISTNEYPITLASEKYTSVKTDKKILVYDQNGESIPVLNRIGLKYKRITDLVDIRLVDFDLLITANMDKENEVPYNWEDVKSMCSKGKNVIMLHPGKHLRWLYLKDMDTEYERTGRVVSMNIPEHDVFKGLEPLDLSWWEIDENTRPRACRRSFRFRRSIGETELCTYLRPHVYVGNPEEELPTMSGSPLIELTVSKGKIIASEMELNVGDKNPVAARLLKNIIEYLSNE